MDIGYSVMFLNPMDLTQAGPLKWFPFNTEQLAPERSEGAKRRTFYKQAITDHIKPIQAAVNRICTCLLRSIYIFFDNFNDPPSDENNVLCGSPNCLDFYGL
ncbi:hypothetical protein TSAR_009828 [Trichomalopsis sarcophagae]|uniref:Uncharacterized protein n=1 Tax=Trichomalopsis sarcophagae TaxID=543379 RepID=A0A232END5_9HYME|nr:hypothetical protein TSAR_009828 [Trichomalopsis sarcophagae]